jgi:hypothetical protein
MSTPKPRGRPPTNRIRRNVYLDPSHIEALREFGGGNISAGIRILIERHLTKKRRSKC